jgi:hypothetical protein
MAEELGPPPPPLCLGIGLRGHEKGGTEAERERLQSGSIHIPAALTVYTACTQDRRKCGRHAVLDTLSQLSSHQWSLIRKSAQSHFCEKKERHLSGDRYPNISNRGRG